MEMRYATDVAKCSPLERGELRNTTCSRSIPKINITFFLRSSVRKFIYFLYLPYAINTQEQRKWQKWQEISWRICCRTVERSTPQCLNERPLNNALRVLSVALYRLFQYACALACTREFKHGTGQYVQSWTPTDLRCTTIVRVSMTSLPVPAPCMHVNKTPRYCNN